jgi:hypothetical protein
MGSDDVKGGPDDDYWDHVDAIVAKANSLGLYVGLLPAWGDKWNKKWGVGPEIFTPSNAAAYGEWLGRRYRERGIVWIVGGDRPVETEAHRQVVRAMAEGLRRGDGGAHLVTFHPPGGNGSSIWFHDEDWLDFNMRQNGHAVEFTGRYDQTRADYDRTPPKPVIDGEPIYEGHPVAFKAKELGHSIAADVRRPLYWNLFSGACGHTYGHHSVWQMWAPDRAPVNDPLLPWFDAFDEPGAGQMRHGRRLIESRPVLTRVPDDSVVVRGRVPTAVPGAGRYRIVGDRGAAGPGVVVRPTHGRGHVDRRVREHRRARVRPARSRRAPRLGARARRRGAGLRAARHARSPVTARSIETKRAPEVTTCSPRSRAGACRRTCTWRRACSRRTRRSALHARVAERAAAPGRPALRHGPVGGSDGRSSARRPTGRYSNSVHEDRRG